MATVKKVCSGRFCEWKDSCMHYIKYQTEEYIANFDNSKYVYSGRTTDCIGNNVFKEYVPASEEWDMRKDRDRYK